ncbi:DUF2145 domain-containing protein [Janthinobacterium sp. B9-8]|uniref:DUF2145 domain-containing protein n=1 Tax=Janthinobacterium sp. B9-8 TaxID=1236179 RepID=UPI00061D0206|nr:DUF2145 domain-containing protein [Janthinobacterium sp. B9-8]AMC35941.1 hypothetical protein VN23_15720 [Janthinobacterium sp. B9-8]
MRLNQWLLGLIASLLMSHVWAGRACQDASPNTETFRQAMAAGYASMQQLDEIKPKVALIARVGQDLSAYNLRFSHLGFVWRDPSAQGQWWVMHLLNQCGTVQSDLWREGLANFFMDDPFAYDALIIVPSIAVQDKLQSWLSEQSKMEQLHGSKYNMLAYPFSTLYQNSNQWVLEGLASAMSRDLDIRSRVQAQQWLKLMNYQPSELKINTFKRLGGRMFRANIAFDDHPTDRRMAGKIDTVTVDSIVNFLQQAIPESRSYLVEAKKLPELR